MFIPYGNRVLVERQKDKVTKTGIHLPDSDPSFMKLQKGKVIAKSHDFQRHDGVYVDNHPSTCINVGDIIWFNQSFEVEDKLVVSEHDIIAIEKEENANV